MRRATRTRAGRGAKAKCNDVDFDAMLGTPEAVDDTCAFLREVLQLRARIDALKAWESRFVPRGKRSVH